MDNKSTKATTAQSSLLEHYFILTNSIQINFANLMLFVVEIEASLCPEGSAADWERADEFVHSAVEKQEVVRHLVIGAAVRPAFRTDGFPLVWLQVMQQMQSELVVHSRKLQAANAANGRLDSVDIGLNF